MEPIHELFAGVLKIDGRFVYLPYNAWQEYENGEGRGVEFQYLDHLLWRHHDIFPHLRKIELGTELLFKPNLTDWDTWRMVVRRFDLGRGRGYIDFLDGAAAVWLSTPIKTGKKERGRWLSNHGGCLTVILQMYPQEQVTRIAHLVEEDLHQARKAEPSKIIRVAELLEFEAVK